MGIVSPCVEEKRESFSRIAIKTGFVSNVPIKAGIVFLFANRNGNSFPMCRGKTGIVFLIKSRVHCHDVTTAFLVNKSYVDVQFKTTPANNKASPFEKIIHSHNEKSHLMNQ